MPAKRCIETKNMCLLFVDYCTLWVLASFFLSYTQFPVSLWVLASFFLSYTHFLFFLWVIASRIYFFCVFSLFSSHADI